MIGPDIRVFGRGVCAYRLCGFAGLAAAALLSWSLARHAGLSLLVMAGITATAILTFLLLALATKVITGEEQLTYYHHEIAVMSAAAVLLRLLHQPLLPYLDVTILGVGMFLACGRTGCLIVGCCHGRPSKWGVCYREPHVQAGFPRYLAGVRLFPIQAVEAVTVFSIVIAGAAMVLNGRPPGTALAWYVVAYGFARFCFEFARGDPDRRYWWGFSESQWISMLLIASVLCAERKGVPAWALLAAVPAAIGYIRHSSFPIDRLLDAVHVREVAAAMDQCSLRTIATSRGVQISSGRIETAGQAMAHYAFSRPGLALNNQSAVKFARLIFRLGRYSGEPQLIEGRSGVFHLLIAGPKI